MKNNTFKIMKHKLFIALTIAMLALGYSACGGRPSGPQGMMAEVAIITIEPQNIKLTTKLPGRTSSFLMAEVRPQVSGIIQKRLFEEGSDVQEGQLLYQIDAAPFQAAYDNAKANLARAEANLPAIKGRESRYRDLLVDKAVSQQDYDDTTAALKQAQAEVAYGKAALESARINLEFSRITAPISGRIGKSNVTVGALVTAYQPLTLATIQQWDPIYVDVSQSTVEVARLRRALEGNKLKQDNQNQSKVKLILDDGTYYPLEGTLQFRDISVDPSTGSVVLRIVFPNPDKVLLPNMFVRAEVESGINENAILVPQQAVSRDPKGNPLVMTVDATNVVQPRMLTLDQAVGDKWLVTSGLAAGDRVIVEGLQKVRPGMPAKVVPFGQTPAGQPQPAANAK